MIRIAPNIGMRLLDLIDLVSMFQEPMLVAFWNHPKFGPESQPKIF
jgi:hypothetical protein